MNSMMRELLSVSSWWWAVQGRLLSALCLEHWVRRHETRWRVSIDLPLCAGDLTCETCNLLVWSGAGPTIPWFRKAGK